MVQLDLREPVTREGIAAEVYKLSDAWGYCLVFEGDIAQVTAMVEPVYALTGAVFFVVPNLPSVVERLYDAGKQA